MLKRVLCLLLLIPASAYANDCNRLTLSSNPEYPPYLWQTNTEPEALDGILVSFTERLNKVANLDVDVVYAGPWLRTQTQVHNGNIDLIAVFYTEDRAQWLDYLQPELIKTDTAIWVNKANVFEFQQLQDLKNRAGITVLGHSLGQQSDNYANENLTISKVSSIEQALLMLEEQRAEYLVYARDPGQAYATQLNTKDVITLPTAVSTEFIYLAFSKQSQCNTSAIREKLSAALLQAQQENWADEFLTLAQQQWQQQSALQQSAMP